MTLKRGVARQNLMTEQKTSQILEDGQLREIDLRMIASLYQLNSRDSGENDEISTTDKSQAIYPLDNKLSSVPTHLPSNKPNNTCVYTVATIPYFDQIRDVPHALDHGIPPSPIRTGNPDPIVVVKYFAYRRRDCVDESVNRRTKVRPHSERVLCIVSDFLTIIRSISHISSKKEGDVDVDIDGLCHPNSKRKLIPNLRLSIPTERRQTKLPIYIPNN
ncbi:hypothetical protein SNEBB_009541 [Seison nebaliae]|nr:hypothetical protein SNEBB_009541 [Seison nebaliae]